MKFSYGIKLILLSSFSSLLKKKSASPMDFFPEWTQLAAVVLAQYVFFFQKGKLPSLQSTQKGNKLPDYSQPI